MPTITFRLLDEQVQALNAYAAAKGLPPGTALRTLLQKQVDRTIEGGAPMSFLRRKPRDKQVKVIPVRIPETLRADIECLAKTYQISAARVQVSAVIPALAQAVEPLGVQLAVDWSPLNARIGNAIPDRARCS